MTSSVTWNGKFISRNSSKNSKAGWTLVSTPPAKPSQDSDAPGEELQLLLAGRASAYDSAGARLHDYSPGDAIWPAGTQNDKATSVVADQPCRTMVLPLTALHWLDEHEEGLALKLYRYLLAARFQTESESG